MKRFVAGVLLGCVVGFAIARLFEAGAGSDVGAPHPAEKASAIAPAADSSSASPTAANAPGGPEGATIDHDSSAERAVVADDDRVPDGEIRGRFVGRDGQPIESAHIHAIAAIALSEPQFNPSLGASMPRSYGPEDSDAVAITRSRGAFALFGLREDVEYALFASRPKEVQFLDLTGPVLVGSAKAGATDLRLVDATCQLIVSFELDAELAALADSEPHCSVSVSVACLSSHRSVGGEDLGLRRELVCWVPADVPLALTFRGRPIPTKELRDVIVTSADGERRLLVPLAGWGAGNQLKLLMEDQDGKPLERAAIAILPGKDVPPMQWTIAPSATEARQKRLENGSFVQMNVTPGPNTIFVAAPLALGLAPAAVTVEVAASGETRLKIVLAKAGRLRIVVKEAALPLKALGVAHDRPGDPTANVWLIPEGQESSSVISWVPAVPMDIVSAQAMTPGDYALTWMRPPKEMHRKSFRVIAGEETTVTVP